jgi:hydroxyacylglutathione hydrolase
LVTHHHYDHIDGIEALLREFPATPVFGPANESIKWLTIKLAEGEQIDLPDLKCSLSVLEVPGHTAGHIAYYGQDTDNPVLFCGDTLFAAGCGRLFDGTAEQLHASLCRLSKLPGNTRVYCTHEYTLNNLRFAKCVEPGNAEIVAREKKVIQQRQHNLPSLPSTIADELLSNPFLRVDQAEVKNSVTEFAKCNLESSLEVFSNLRRWKDRF